MIEINVYKKFENVKENDDQIFITDKNKFKIIGIADGVSNCSKGRVASATLCYALNKYCKLYPIKADLTEYVNKAIDYAIGELKEVKLLFDEHYSSLIPSAYPEINTINEDKNMNTSSIIKGIDELESLKKDEENSALNYSTKDHNTQIVFSEEEKEDDIKDSSKIISTHNEIIFEIENENKIEKKYSPPFINELEKKLIEIFSELKEFNFNEYKSITTFVSNILHTVTKIDESFIFQSTLSLNILKIEKECVELNSFNYGDSELLIISTNPLLFEIDSQITHYKLQQGDLKSFISSSKGRNGRLDISTRKLYENDLLFIGSDGTYFSKTIKASGNPFSPLHNLIVNCLRKNDLSQLPTFWFEKLKFIKALDDDFSMFLVACSKKAEDEKKSKKKIGFLTKLNFKWLTDAIYILQRKI